MGGLVHRAGTPPSLINRASEVAAQLCWACLRSRRLLASPPRGASRAGQGLASGVRGLRDPLQADRSGCSFSGRERSDERVVLGNRVSPAEVPKGKRIMNFLIRPPGSEVSVGNLDDPSSVISV